MKDTAYNIVRVNTPSHNNFIKARSDMAFIIERGFFWKKSERIHAPVGSPIIAMGSHGGRGLFLFGMVTGKWEHNPDKADEYTQRLPMLWQPVIYQHPVSAVDEVKAMLPVYNHRFGSRDIEPRQFARVFAFVASGKVLPPDYHGQSQAA